MRNLTTKRCGELCNGWLAVSWSFAGVRMPTRSVRRIWFSTSAQRRLALAACAVQCSVTLFCQVQLAMKGDSPTIDRPIVVTKKKSRVAHLVWERFRHESILSWLRLEACSIHQGLGRCRDPIPMPRLSL